MFESLKSLNEYQKDAVLNEDKVLILNASVGSGKTTVLVHKVLYLYHVKKVPFSDMVVLTFTNKAAGEIKDRVLSSDSSISKDELSYFGTFHSVARNLLANVLPIESLGYDRNFTIIDEASFEELIDNVINIRGLNIKYRNKIQKRLEQYRNGTVLYGNMKYHDEIDKLIEILGEEKKKRNVMDFDDLIASCSKLLKVGNFKPSWIIVDEFQDTDESQLKMIDGMIGPDTHVFAVGDPNQIIYTWRGSRQDIFDIFKNRYSAVEKTLPINYRSTDTILRAARVFLNNPQSLKGYRECGGPIIVKRHYNAFMEAIYLSDTIKKLHEQGVPYSEIAVFYRMQKQSEVFEEVFARESIPYEVSVRKSIRDIPVLYWFMRLLKVSINNKDIDSLLYVLQDKKYGLNISQKNIKKLLVKVENGGKNELPELVKKIERFGSWCSDIGFEGFEYKIYDYFDIDAYISPTSIYYEEDKELIMKYIDILKEYIVLNNCSVFDGIKSFLDNSTIYGREIIKSIIDPESDSVKLMTLHASKGMEFKYVFISGANYGVIPMYSRGYDEEEKRLFYVGITRAKDYLEISYHANPEDYSALPDPSPYITAIPDELIESEEVKSRASSLSELRREVKNNIDKKQYDNEKEPKKKVAIHPKYGEGYVVSENDDTIIVDFGPYGERSFSKLFCPLKFES